jgi:hypothetical protein
MQTIIDTNTIMDVITVSLIRWIQLLSIQRLLRCDSCERQRSVNDLWHCVITHPVGFAVTVSHNRTIGRPSIEKW